MNCVYRAYEQYLEHLGRLELRIGALDLFRDMMIATHADEEWRIQPVHATNGATVPWMIKCLLGASGLVATVQHRIIRPENWRTFADNGVQRYLAQHADWGEYSDPLTLAPAIYLLWGRGHAVFAEEVPQAGVPIVAIQIREV